MAAPTDALPREPRRLRRSRAATALSWRDFAGVAGLVVLLHCALLVALDPPLDDVRRGAAAPRSAAPTAMQARVLPPRSASPDRAPTPAPIASPPVAPVAGARVTAIAAVPERPSATGPAAGADAGRADRAPIPPAAALPAASGVPVYPTRPPPAFAYAYALQLGAERGSLELRWRPEGDRYEASLSGMLGGAPLLALHSSGGFDAAGLAPLRHTDGRRGRSPQAANFRREDGRITFSGSKAERVLVAGAQDRLSWMLQLAAIAAADPSLVAPGGRIALAVVGARGDAGVWTFVHVADEVLALSGGDTPAVRLLRLPEQPYDTRAEVWLDPARHYLPLRVQLSNPPSARDALQLEWRGALPERAVTP